MKKLIKELTSIIGPSSYEKPVADYIEKKLKVNKKLKIKRDVLGNLIVRKPGKGKKIMLAAHMDEIGFMAKYIDDKGFVRFSIVGGIFPHNIIHNRVTFTSGVEGVIGFETKDYNYKDILPMNKLYIDIGARDKKEAEKMVKIGDLASVKPMFSDMNNRISAKALDDRIGCAILMEIAMSNIKSNNDIYFVFTVQEEVGLRGARTSAFGIDPDLAIAVDITGSGDTPEANLMDVHLGNGPTVKVKDSGIVVKRKVIDYMSSIAEKYKIPYQLEILERGATDAAAINTIKSGVLAGVVSIPTRYGHSQSETIDINDAKNAVKLIKHIVEDNIAKKGF